MKNVFTLILIIFFLDSNAQIIRVSTTPTSITGQVPGYSQVSSIATKTISYTPSTPATSVTPIDEDTTTEDSKVYRYADILPVTITTADGNITSTTAGKVWTLKLIVTDALNVGFTFNQFDLSPNAEMYVFDDGRTMLDSAIKKSHFSSSSRVSIFAVKGSSATIYIVEPGNFGTLQSVVGISKVEAGFQEIETVGDVGSAILRSPSVNCDPMVRCQSSRMDMARTVAGFSTNGFRGTGTMLNNENRNGQAFFLSAFHVVDANDNGIIDASEENALADATFEFQFWRTTCNGTINNRSIRFTGAALRSANRSTDAILLELLNPPGVGDGVNYAGWSRQTTAPDDYGSFILHHPKGHDMRITNTRVVRTFFWNNNFWTAKYNSGTVDKGSSGAAIFNENNQVVGQLRGGWSNCNFTDFGDRYGKFHQTWTDVGLQTWLSPSSSLSSVSPLILFPIEMTGQEYFSCSGPDNIYTVPNLLGCTYTWTTSSNLQIISGQNTSTAVIHSISTLPHDIGWVEVFITDSKGRQRTSSVRKLVQMGIPYFMEVTYQNASGNNGYFCSSHFGNKFTVNPTGTSTSYKYRLRDLASMNIVYTDPNLYTSFPITISYTPPAGWYLLEIKIFSSCGESEWLEQEVEYLDCSSMEAMKGSLSFDVTISPNPVYGNLHVTIDNKKTNNSAVQEPENIQFILYDFNRTGPVKQWTAPNTGNQHSLSLHGVLPGQYILLVQKGKYRKATQLIVR